MVIAVASLVAAPLGRRARREGVHRLGRADPDPRDRGRDVHRGRPRLEGLWESRAALPAAAVTEFGALVEAAARPIDDVRGTAAYRHHALGVLGRRTLQWAWAEYREEAA